jgi:diguanylate cyclase (GGDEF)-like protein/PAS domain S-box-containing protein
LSAVADNVESESDAPTPRCRLTRDSAAIITSVDDAITDVLGWTPGELIGNPSTEFIHPDDQPSAVAAWFEMLAAPGATGVWRGRYRSAAGTWCWIESVNENHLDDPDDPIVVSTITPVTVNEVSIEEELRARTQTFAALADALPVGVVQFNADAHITFANDRLHSLVGLDSFATVAAALRGVDAADVPALDDAIAGVLAGGAVDELELHLPGHASGRAHVFEMSLRPLTDADGIVTGGIGCVSDVTDRVRLRRELEHQASCDPLTQCLNRTAILERLGDMLASMHPADDGVAVLFVDLDAFKTTNDDYGHATGDAVLIETARRLQSELRRRDALGRIGGDEFLVVCPEISSAAAAHDMVARIGAAVHGPHTVEGEVVAIRATIGLAWTPRPMPRELLVSEADHDMYARKREARSHSERPAASGG